MSPTMVDRIITLAFWLSIAGAATGLWMIGSILASPPACT